MQTFSRVIILFLANLMICVHRTYEYIVYVNRSSGKYTAKYEYYYKTTEERTAGKKRIFCSNTSEAVNEKKGRKKDRRKRNRKTTLLTKSGTRRTTMTKMTCTHSQPAFNKHTMNMSAYVYRKFIDVVCSEEEF